MTSYPASFRHSINRQVQITRAFAALVLCVLIETAAAQQVATLRVFAVTPLSSHSVQVFVTVHDPEGRRIEGLGAANFAGLIGSERVSVDSVARVEYNT